jgi:nucleotide-binding universal stress UspA family protein
VRITRPRIRIKRGAPRIVVAVDGSAGADAALETVAFRAWPKGSRFLVLGAYEFRPNPGVLLGEGGAELAATFSVRRKADLEQAVAAAAGRLARKGLAAKGAVKEGDPRTTLVDEAEAWGADGIFLGSRGLGTWDRILLGSVSSTVASHAACTVEVIRSRTRAGARSRAGADKSAARNRKRGE